jgi:hypothetical protein
VEYGNDATDSSSFHASLTSDKNHSETVDVAAGTELRHCGKFHKLLRHYFA